MSTLPGTHYPFTDKYFLRAEHVLMKQDLNPWVRYQFFFRKETILQGMETTLTALKMFSDFVDVGGCAYALDDGSEILPDETVLVLEGPIQSLMSMETILLSILSSATAGPMPENYLEKAETKIRSIKEIIGGDRPVYYLGARHYGWEFDEDIARAAFNGGALNCSTDCGAKAFGSQEGMGTIPHSLECIYAWKNGRENAVMTTIQAFDDVFFDTLMPRVSLVDFNNEEIKDSLASAEILYGRLSAVRLDTCGENVQEGALADPRDATGELTACRNLPYFAGTGVTISGAYAIRRALDDEELDYVKIILSSGFGKIEKVQAFVDAEVVLGIRLFDSLGVGGLFGSTFATSDIVSVGEDRYSMLPMSKKGREYNPNPKLKQVIGE